VPGIDSPQLQSIQADIHDERSVANAVAGAYGVVNAVSLYVERGNATFHSVHVEAGLLSIRPEDAVSASLKASAFEFKISCHRLGAR
jgi:hypothetical protein